jgi:shikimate kinase
MPTRPPRIEIVGVAGSGKSTLTQTLRQRYTGCRVADSLHTRVPAHWPYVAHSLPRLLRLIARHVRRRPPLSWEEIKWIIYVLEWSRFLRASREYRRGVTLLDQGPIFGLARLLWGRKPITRSGHFQAWVDEMVERWSQEIDLLVWLVAPDHALLERINHRDQRHEAKGKSMQEGLELIKSHGQAYGQLFELIDRLGRPRVLRFDTDAMSPVEIADELAEIFETRTARSTAAHRCLDLDGYVSTQEGL